MAYANGIEEHSHTWQLLGLTGDRYFCRCGAVREPNGEGGYCITSPLRGAAAVPPIHVPGDPDGIVLR